MQTRSIVKKKGTLQIDRDNFFHQTVDDMYTGPNAMEIKDRAVKMRMLFESKLFDNQSGGMKSII